MRDVSAATTTLSARPFAQTRAPSFSEAAERHLDDVYRYLLVFTRDAATSRIAGYVDGVAQFSAFDFVSPAIFGLLLISCATCAFNAATFLSVSFESAALPR